MKREVSAREGRQVIWPSLLTVLTVAFASYMLVPARLEFNNIALHVIAIGAGSAVVIGLLTHRLLNAVMAESEKLSVIRVMVEKIVQRQRDAAVNAINEESRRAAHLMADCQREAMLPVDFSRTAYSRITDLPETVKAAWDDHVLRVTRELDARCIK